MNHNHALIHPCWQTRTPADHESTDFVSSPPDTASPKFPGHSQTPSTSQCRSPQPEPLLSLLTTAHPLVASTIGGASSAYGGAKNFSPRFKSSAEYVEGYLTPIANTVNSVGRVTGVEGGVRWFLGARRNSTAAVNGNSKKRRKTGEADEIANKKSREMAIGDVDMSTLTPKSTRRSSSASTVDTLPAYDELRSPAYTESVVASSPHDTPRSVANTSWQSRLITSTSGLSIAMSAESLKSLKYCLKWLRWTNGHMSQVIGNLKSTLEEYEETAEAQIATSEGAEAHNSHSGGNESNQPDARTQEQAQEQARNELSAKINTLKVDVLKTLQETINLVSNYAGGALPENARVLVRRHLTSLPQRFRVASMTDSPAAHGDRDGDSAVREGAQKVLVLAKEGLDMVTQITGVVDDTIISAEQWCERMGKRRRVPNDGGQMDSPSVEPVGTSGDSRDDMMSAV